MRASLLPATSQGRSASRATRLGRECLAETRQLPTDMIREFHRRFDLRVAEVLALVCEKKVCLELLHCPLHRHPSPPPPAPRPAPRAPRPPPRAPLPATRYPLPATRYPLPATRYPLPATRYPLPATLHPLPAPGRPAPR